MEMEMRASSSKRASDGGIHPLTLSPRSYGHLARRTLPHPSPPPPPCDGRRHPIQEAPDGGRQCPVAVEGEDVRHLVGRPVRHVGEEKMVAAVASDLVTPEKTEPRPLLRRAALELHRADRGPAAEVDAGVDALESVERELGVGAGAYRRPVKRRPEFKLPESYEILCEFVNCFESSTRLLRMKGSKATFPNICASIQNLARRRFTYGHLAQLKYIMPEAMMLAFILQNLGVQEL
ncbi:hypothetical protein ZWY2020_058156 [Hordeum vulgare]|nr:hypothetical protein ZWY2020_058156 [Hordeum vulgare]